MSSRKKISAKAATFTIEQTEAYMLQREKLKKEKAAKNELRQKALAQREIDRKAAEQIRLEKAEKAKAIRIEEQKAFEATQTRFGSKRTKNPDAPVKAKPGLAGRTFFIVSLREKDNPKPWKTEAKPQKTRKAEKKAARTRALLAMAA